MMEQGAEFLEYLQLQGNLDMISKSELLDVVRKRGARISDRQLTTFISEGVLPESARIGSRSGAYPKLIAELLWWVVNARDRGLSIKAIKELLPLWRFLVESCHNGELSLAEFEYRARQQVTLLEAAFAIPALLLNTMPCPMCQAEDLGKTKLINKNGDPVALNGEQPVTIDFVVFSQDEETGAVRRVAHMPVQLSVPREDPVYRVVLGIPVGVELPVSPQAPAEPVSAGALGAGPKDEEV